MPKILRSQKSSRCCPRPTCNGYQPHRPNLCLEWGNASLPRTLDGVQENYMSNRLPVRCPWCIAFQHSQSCQHRQPSQKNHRRQAAWPFALSECSLNFSNSPPRVDSSNPRANPLWLEPDLAQQVSVLSLFPVIVVAEGLDELRVVEFSLRTFASATLEFWIGRIEGILWLKDARIRGDSKVGTEVRLLGKHFVEVVCRCVVEVVGGQAMQPVDRPNDAHDRGVLVRDIAAFGPWADA